MGIFWRQGWRWGAAKAGKANFIYYNDSTETEELTDSQWQTLVAAKPGERLQILRVPEKAQGKLLGMGLAPGVVVEVHSRLPSGSVVVARDGQRLGLGAELAQQIAVVAYRGRGQPMRLQDAAVGTRLRVVGYAPTAGDYKRRLLAMGLTPGTVLEVKRHAPLGDPIEIWVRGFALSLRKTEADALLVEPV